MNDLQRQTTESSIRLIQAMLRDLRFLGGRLDTHPESGEDLLQIASTLSESVKKLASALENDPAPKKKEARTLKIDRAAMRNFLKQAAEIEANESLAAARE